MIFEHFAINVEDLQATMAWYVTHIGLRIRSTQAELPFTSFLEDGSGRVVLELYQRTDVDCTNFSQQHPITFHIAFVSQDAAADKKRLVAAGASFVEAVNKPDGSQLLMLRDPWGLPLQLCQRAEKF